MDTKCAFCHRPIRISAVTARGGNGEFYCSITHQAFHHLERVNEHNAHPFPRFGKPKLKPLNVSMRKYSDKPRPDDTQAMGV